MTLKIQQEAVPTANRRWKWSVWLVGSAAELSKVEYVKYILHPTYPKPVREVRDRATGFRLSSTGWGVFTLEAKVKVKGVARFRKLKHQLRFGAAETAPFKPGTGSVFVSYSIADERIAATVKDVLAEYGFSASDASGSVGAGASMRDSISKAVASSEAVVAIRSGGLSAWSEFEVQSAKDRNIPVFSLDVGNAKREGNPTPSLSAQVKRAEVESSLAGLLARRPSHKGKIVRS